MKKMMTEVALLVAAVSLVGCADRATGSGLIATAANPEPASSSSTDSSPSEPNETEAVLEGSRLFTPAQRSDEAVARPSLPSGPGLLLGSRLTYDEFVKVNEEAGISEDQLRGQDIFVVDVLQDVGFVDTGDLLGDPSPANITHAEVMDSNLVVVLFEGGCLAPVGGRILVEGESIDITLLTGQPARTTTCPLANYTYRATFYVEGAREGMAVTTGGQKVEAGVITPYLDQLPDLVVWPDLLPSL